MLITSMDIICSMPARSSATSRLLQNHHVTKVAQGHVLGECLLLRYGVGYCKDTQSRAYMLISRTCIPYPV
jgi:hypothetical protein